MVLPLEAFDRTHAAPKDWAKASSITRRLVSKVEVSVRRPASLR